MPFWLLWCVFVLYRLENKEERMSCSITIVWFTSANKALWRSLIKKSIFSEVYNYLISLIIYRNFVYHVCFWLKKQSTVYHSKCMNKFPLFHSLLNTKQKEIISFSHVSSLFAQDKSIDIKQNDLYYNDHHQNTHHHFHLFEFLYPLDHF
jgi:hypothetical protein